MNFFGCTMTASASISFSSRSKSSVVPFIYANFSVLNIIGMTVRTPGKKFFVA